MDPDDEESSWDELYPDKLPSDIVYEDGIRLGDIIFTRFVEAQAVHREIDWNHEIDASEVLLDASTFLATQLHYMNISHLIMYGKILSFEKRGRTFDTQKLVSLLTAYRIEGVESWGRYLGKTAAGVDVDYALRNFYRELFAEDTALYVIVGAELLTTFSYGLYEALDGTGDRLFQQIVARLAGRRQEEMRDVYDYLAPEIEQLPDHGREQLSESVYTYLQHLQPVALSYRGPMETLNVRTSQDHVNNALQEFSENLGFTSANSFRIDKP